MPRCPKCNIPLCRIKLQGVPFHTCPDCGGELIENLRLKAVERRGDPGWTDADKDAFCRLADESNNLDDVICPRCARIMRKFLFRNYANLQVDQCPECGIYWLDPGELEKMQVLYQETRAHYTEEDWVTVEKEARALVAMDARKAELEDLRGPDGSGGALGFTRGPAAAAGAALGTLVGMYLLDRRVGEIDDRAEAVASGTPLDEAAFAVPPHNPPARRSTCPRFVAVLVLALLTLLVLLAARWALRNL